VNQKRFYLQAVKKYGTGAKALHWKSEQAQRIRFKVIAAQLPISGEFRIVDAGCGFADFYHYLKRSHTNDAMSYLGLEYNEALIKKSAHQHHIAHCNVLRDTLPKADYYVCSGALNLLTPFEAMLFIMRCFKHATVGVIFNVLMSQQKSDNQSIYNVYDMSSLSNLLSRFQNVKIVMGYLCNDITIKILH